MTRITSLFFFFVLLIGASGCGSNSTTPTTPTPVTPTQVSDTFTGTIAPLGTDTHNFTVTYTAGSNASITINSLVTVADQTPQSITIGVGFGYLNLGVCTVVLTNPAAPLGTELATTSQPFSNGTFCVQVFDNTAAPTVLEPLTYSLTVKHY